MGGRLHGYTWAGAEARRVRCGTACATAAASCRTLLILHRLYSADSASSCIGPGCPALRNGSSSWIVPQSCSRTRVSPDIQQSYRQHRRR